MTVLDDGLHEPTKTEQVMIVTFREVIEGTLFHNENVRLSDALNSEAHQHSRYVSLKSATVYSISTGREIMKTGFLMVSHSHVIYMTPKGAVQMAATESAQAQAVRDTEESQQAVPTEPGLSRGGEASQAATAESKAAQGEFHWGPPRTPDAARQAVVHGTDSHLMSRQAMLQTLAAIRSQEKDAGMTPSAR